MQSGAGGSSDCLISSLTQMMKFGSRMDIIVPTNTVINAKVGDRVVGGETILGQLQ